ncbi:MAG TPA: SRPBCC domain-containing protein [Polyangiaceae bacterium]|jgi:uncharacterized protein YndB with AHSA1/START domain
MSAAIPAVALRRKLNAPVDRVFGAFAQADLVSRWLTPSPEIKLTVLDFDFRVGGSYRFAYLTPDGTRMLVGGSYRAIEPPRKLVFSWLIEPPDPHAGIESLVTITLIPSGSGTELTIRHENWGRADANARHDEGWNGAVDRLTELLAGEETKS